jgi:GTP cyclohydrolase I
MSASMELLALTAEKKRLQSGKCVHEVPFQEYCDKCPMAARALPDPPGGLKYDSSIGNPDRPEVKPVEKPRKPCPRGTRGCPGVAKGRECDTCGASWPSGASSGASACVHGADLSNHCDECRPESRVMDDDGTPWHDSTKANPPAGNSLGRAAKQSPLPSNGCMADREECTWDGSGACGDCGKVAELDQMEARLNALANHPRPPAEPDGCLPSVAAAVALLMSALRLDLGDENFRDTPDRVAKALGSFCKGEGGIQEAMRSDFTFVSDSDTLVAEQGIPVAALCPHHLLPWFGTVDIGYIPNGMVLGLSKFPRLVHAISHSCPMMQEQFTDLLAMYTQKRLGARGLIITVRAQHTCMVCRGVETPEVRTITSRVSGVFRDVPAARMEFLMLTQAR